MGQNQNPTSRRHGFASFLPFLFAEPELLETFLMATQPKKTTLSVKGDNVHLSMAPGFHPLQNEEETAIEAVVSTKEIMPKAIALRNLVWNSARGPVRVWTMPEDHIKNILQYLQENKSRSHNASLSTEEWEACLVCRLANIEMSKIQIRKQLKERALTNELLGIEAQLRKLKTRREEILVELRK